MPDKKDAYQPDKKLTAVCGLFCPACSVFIAQRKGLEERRKLAQKLQVPVEVLKCDGCRTQNRYIYCETCHMVACAQNKGIDFCGACEEYPCAQLKEFKAALPHRIELWESQARIKEVGYEKWFEEMLDHYACRQCGTINSAYHMACRECGAAPSCAYVDLHKTEINAYGSKKRKSPKDDGTQ